MIIITVFVIASKHNYNFFILHRHTSLPVAPERTWKWGRVQVWRKAPEFFCRALHVFGSTNRPYN